MGLYPSIWSVNSLMNSWYDTAVWDKNVFLQVVQTTFAFPNEESLFIHDFWT